MLEPYRTTGRGPIEVPPVRMTAHDRVVIAGSHHPRVFGEIECKPGDCLVHFIQGPAAGQIEFGQGLTKLRHVVVRIPKAGDDYGAAAIERTLRREVKDVVVEPDDPPVKHPHSVRCGSGIRHGENGGVEKFQIEHGPRGCPSGIEAQPAQNRLIQWWSGSLA